MFFTMPDIAALKPHYNYWDNFVRLWRLGRYPRAPYLPEPWWGWHPDSGEELHSVVLNLNPGSGGRLQSRCCVACVMGCPGGNASYSSAMTDGTLRLHLADTERWHHRRRYKPLIKALGADEKEIAPDTRHHLSIELLPFHDDVDNRLYCRDNRDKVLSHALRFAACASRLISSPLCVSEGAASLRNIVIARCAVDKIIEIAGAENITDISTVPAGNSKIKAERFRLKEAGFSDVLFVSLSGARNNLPSPESLKEILKTINNSNY